MALLESRPVAAIDLPEISLPDAVCTPDLTLFDVPRPLHHRWQLDASRPGNDVDVTGAELVAGAPAPGPPRPSTGCNGSRLRSDTPS